MKIEVGMYVRTKCGIEQIYRIDNNKTKWKYVYKLKEQDGDGCINIGILSSEDILKASHKIEDLLKKGDYVNGYMITDFSNEYYDEELDDYVEGFSIVLGNEEQMYSIPPKDIKSIVTKEQFEAIQFKVV